MLCKVIIFCDVKISVNKLVLSLEYISVSSEYYRISNIIDELVIAVSNVHSSNFPCLTRSRIELPESFFKIV
jgi:hypothetical protein